MNNLLAERILVKIMKWDLEKINEERPLIQALGKLKYDEYQQFSTGMRFTESLVNWLNQFDKVEEKNIAYDFLKRHLIFITSTQINHLISICFPQLIDPVLRAKAAIIESLHAYQVKKIQNSNGYREAKRKALFLGFSDGAKIDQLRRLAGLNNEQVFSSYHISEDKMEDLVKELSESLHQTSKFSSLFLIDDFTASGLSYLRIEEGKGKLLKLLAKIVEPKNEAHKSVLRDLLELNELTIHIIYYVATRKALNYVKKGIEDWKVANNQTQLPCTVDAVQIIEESTPEAVRLDLQFMNIISQDKYFDKTIIDKHYEKGRTEKPYLGFDEGALPVVLNHNTPNNSLPIFWFSGDLKIAGLFPRVLRHKE